MEESEVLGDGGVGGWVGGEALYSLVREAVGRQRPDLFSLRSGKGGGGRRRRWVGGVGWEGIEALLDEEEEGIHAGEEGFGGRAGGEEDGWGGGWVSSSSSSISSSLSTRILPSSSSSFSSSSSAHIRTEPRGYTVHPQLTSHRPTQQRILCRHKMEVVSC